MTYEEALNTIGKKYGYDSFQDFWHDQVNQNVIHKAYEEAAELYAESVKKVAYRKGYRRGWNDYYDRSPYNDDFNRIPQNS